ncbi:septum site-determining protein MinD [Alkalihalobacillus oceani]|uniref:septum site-determining protein MinD n=1 Tax=Halalkalibacter oceani TaxID=1653776 RepID=UPI00203DE963|nr:septum site-determining protein MinD [Halalkalibacter oceani]MCM3760195.1 septum site-determining protein MinD [Halalkalibacter oceani]
MTKVIAITSGKGGVGKTTVRANVGAALALMGKKVCVVDADFGLCNLDIPLGLTNRIIFDLFDYFNHASLPMKSVLVKDKYVPNLYLLPGHKNGSFTECDPVLFHQAISDLRESGQFDYVLIDSPAGIEKGFETVIQSSDEAIIVTTPDLIALRDADRVIGILEETLRSSSSLVINWYNEKEGGKGGRLSIEEVLQTLAIPLLGAILEDEAIITSVQRGKVITLQPELENGMRFRHIGRNIVKQETKAYQSIKSVNKRAHFMPLSFVRGIAH